MQVGGTTSTEGWSRRWNAALLFNIHVTVTAAIKAGN